MADQTESRQVMGATPPKAIPPKNDPTASMSFLDHLEELRWRIMKGLLGVGAGVIIAFIFSDFLVNKVILGPASSDFFMYDFMGISSIDLSLISRRLPGQFFTYWGTLIIAGAVIGSPIFIYQIWSFVEPAIESAGKWKTYKSVIFITSFFLTGVSFGYFILVPFALQFFGQFIISDIISNEFDINEYFTSVALWTFSCGLIFQVPVVSYFLSKVGLLTPEFLKKYRRQAVLVILVVAAFITPPDPVSQIMIAIPLVLLYQLAIWVSKVANKQREEELKKAFSENRSSE